jgi:hypothetical protein
MRVLHQTCAGMDVPKREVGETLLSETTARTPHEGGASWKSPIRRAVG